MVTILGFHCRGLGSVSGWVTDIPQAVQLGQAGQGLGTFQVLNVSKSSMQK